MFEPRVKISSGQIRGECGTDMVNRKFFKFVGVPYAKPPIGHLRFKAPLPAEPWSGTRDATEEGNPCYSKNPITGTSDGSEDCLYLNVFTKQLPDSSNAELKPVMVFFHGGGFVGGSSKADLIGPEFLMTEDIVLVTLNYRLGALGFLSLEDTSLKVHGNAGIKDQLLALQWVQENIKVFCGDPNNVTIFGGSAGASSVHFLILSPRAKGLFHKAILQSGCALNGWALGKGAAAAKDLVEHLGYKETDERVILKILQNAPVEELLQAQLKIYDHSVGAVRRPFVPIVEVSTPEAIIDQQPIDILYTGNYNKVPMIMGFNDKEGMVIDLYKNLPGCNFDDLEISIPWQLEVERGSGASKDLAEKLKDFYFRGPDKTDDMHILQSDVVFIMPMMSSLKAHLTTTTLPVYLYTVTADTSLNFAKQVMTNSRKGASHGDEIGYLFKTCSTPKLIPGSIESVSIRRFVKMWTNFAKCGNPTPDKELRIKWKPATKEEICYLDIGEKLVMRKNPISERVAFWREIYKSHPQTENYL